MSEGDIFSAYELYLSAEMYNAAHNLAVLELAPDAVIRQDLDLLNDLFQRFAGQSIDGWEVRGKVSSPYDTVFPTNFSSPFFQVVLGLCESNEPPTEVTRAST